MRRSGPRRFASRIAVMFTVAMLGLGTVTAVLIAPEKAEAASTIGGKITRSEIIGRAAAWYSRRYDADMTYSQSAFTWDATHSRKYRRDCSGLVDMAWHLGSDPNTEGLKSSSYTTRISRSELLPGDILNDTTDSETGYPYHVILFGGWENSAKTSFWYYSFGGTPMRKWTGASFSQDKLAGHPTDEYVPYRYKNVVDDSTPEDDNLADVTGDGFSDVVAFKPDGTMWMYPNNFIRDDGVPYGSAAQIGKGWAAFDEVLPADVTGDGYTDLVGIKTDGTVWLYLNNIERDDGIPYGGTGRQIGKGWQIFDRVIPADVTGDGYTDLLGVKPDGTMWLYLNNYERDDGVPYGGTGREIGHNWNIFNRVIPADVTGDGYADLVAFKSDGTMWLYANNIERDNGIPFGGAGEIGHGWGVFDRVIPADVTGDGFADILALTPGGDMMLYPNNIGRDNGIPFSGTGREVGHNWNIYDRILA